MEAMGEEALDIFGVLAPHEPDRRRAAPLELPAVEPVHPPAAVAGERSTPQWIRATSIGKRQGCSVTGSKSYREAISAISADDHGFPSAIRVNAARRYCSKPAG